VFCEKFRLKDYRARREFVGRSLLRSQISVFLRYGLLVVYEPQSSEKQIAHEKVEVRRP
jgi:hypothetical protein